MSGWLKRMRGAIGTGLTWAAVWAPVAVLVGTKIIDPTNAMDEMWIMVGALPGFVSGVIFSGVLSTVARRRRLEDLSVVRVGGWGALAGLATAIIPMLLGDRGEAPMWPLAVIIVPTFTLLSGLSAAGSLALAQRAIRRETIHGGTSDTISDVSQLNENSRGAINPGIPLQNDFSKDSTKVRDNSVR